MADIQDEADAPVANTPGSRLAQERAAKAAQKAAARGDVNTAETRGFILGNAGTLYAFTY